MSMQDSLTIAAINFHAEWGNKVHNLARIAKLAGEAADQGAQLVLFPETAITGYDHSDDGMHARDAEPVPGPASDALARIARERGIWIVVGLPERDGDAVYNSAIVLGPQGLVGCYRKMHLPGDEARWATRGDRPLLFDTPWGKVGVGICYDTYLFPELLRYHGARGARLYLNPTAAPDFPAFKNLYYTQLDARVVENGFFIASANLVGKDLNSTFPGGSMVLGPGEGILDVVRYGAPVEHEEAIVLATIDLSLADKARARLPMFTTNPLTGDSDWRPRIYARLFDDAAG